MRAQYPALHPHANRKTASMRKGYSYAYRNYGIYDHFSDDGLTEWHPGFSLDGAKHERTPKTFPALLPRLRAEEKSPAGLLLGKPLVSHAACSSRLAESFSANATCLMKRGAR